MSVVQNSPFAFVDGKPLGDFDGITDGDTVGRVLKTGVVIADESANGRLVVKGAAAEVVVAVLFRVEDMAVGAGAVLEQSSRVYRLRHDLFFVETAPGRAAELTAELVKAATASDVFVTVTDVTHGRSEMLLAGVASTALMSKLCGLNFDDRTFPDRTAQRSSFAKTKQLIIRQDEMTTLAFAVIGGRSSASYLWETVMEAGAEFDITPVGANTLRQWRQSGST
jgi:heterotetrameric sarcosine oxidase gamma subunit